MKVLRMFLICVYFGKKIAKAFFGPFVSKDRTVPSCKRFTVLLAKDEAGIR